MLEELKEAYFKKMKELALFTRNSKGYFKAAKMLGSKEASKVWDIRGNVSPGKQMKK